MTMLLLVALLAGLAMAQRPSGSSICDYYAEVRFGTNSSTTQYKLIEGIVAMAFGGGNATSNASSSLTGILNPGKFNDIAVDLHPFFDGSIDSTNLNNQPIGIDWLDGGGVGPLYSYLNGSESSITFENTTNQYRLFSHFLSDFSRMFGCSNPPAAPPSTTGQSGTIDLAYVHKFMNLNQSDLSHFINQLTLTVQYFGFSDEDSQTLNSSMNSQYNVRCAPPDSDGMLQSLCQAESCPLAVPNSDCPAYVNLTANGIASIATDSGSMTATPTPFTPSVVAPITSATSSTSSTPSPVADSSSSSTLAPGAIAGIAIGGAVVLLLAVVVFLVWRYKNKKHRAAPPPPLQSRPTGLGFPSPQMDHDPGMSYFTQPSTPSGTTYMSSQSPPTPSWKGPFTEPPKGHPLLDAHGPEEPLPELDAGEGRRPEMGNWR